MNIFILTSYYRDTYEYSAFQNIYNAYESAIQKLNEYRESYLQKLHYNFLLNEITPLETFCYSFDEIIFHLETEKFIRVWEIDDDAMSYQEIWCTITPTTLY